MYCLVDKHFITLHYYEQIKKEIPWRNMLLLQISKTRKGCCFKTIQKTNKNAYSTTVV